MKEKEIERLENEKLQKLINPILAVTNEVAGYKAYVQCAAMATCLGLDVKPGPLDNDEWLALCEFGKSPLRLSLLIKVLKYEFRYYMFRKNNRYTPEPWVVFLNKQCAKGHEKDPRDIMVESLCFKFGMPVSIIQDGEHSIQLQKPIIKNNEMICQDKPFAFGGFLDRYSDHMNASAYMMFGLYRFAMSGKLSRKKANNSWYLSENGKKILGKVCIPEIINKNIPISKYNEWLNYGWNYNGGKGNMAKAPFVNFTLANLDILRSRLSAIEFVALTKVLKDCHMELKRNSSTYGRRVCPIYTMVDLYIAADIIKRYYTTYSVVSVCDDILSRIKSNEQFLDISRNNYNALNVNKISDGMIYIASDILMSYIENNIQEDIYYHDSCESIWYIAMNDLEDIRDEGLQKCTFWDEYF